MKIFLSYKSMLWYFYTCFRKIFPDVSKNFDITKLHTNETLLILRTAGLRQGWYFYQQRNQNENNSIEDVFQNFTKKLSPDLPLDVETPSNDSYQIILWILSKIVKAAFMPFETSFKLNKMKIQNDKCHPRATLSRSLLLQD